MARKTLNRRTIRPKYVFDIETSNWTEFLCGAIYDVEAKRTVGVFDWTQESEMVETLLSSGGECWAHNGGHFDAKWVLKGVIARDLDARISVSGSRLVSVALANGASIKDSKALFPLSLAALTADNSVQKQKCDVPFSEFSKRMSKQKLAAVKEYCEYDCISLAESIERMSSYAAQNNLDLGNTVGSSAWRNAARLYDIPPADYSSSEHTILRRAYYGGRCEVFKTGAENVFEHDINAAYPDALVQAELPYGNREWVPNDKSGKAAEYFRENQPGVYCCDVEVPDMRIPPLPNRADNGRLLFPVGKWRAWYTQPEAAYAVNVGCNVRAVSACVFSDTKPLLRDWCKRVWALRFAAGKKTPIGQFLKWYANSLTGKLGQRPERTVIHVNPPASAYSRAYRQNWEEISDNPAVFSEVVNGMSDCMHVVWASYLTSITRIKLHKQLVNDGMNGEATVYCDTDSCFSLVERHDEIGDKLGQWEKTGPFERMEILAPKVYRLERGDNSKVRAKGFFLADGKESAAFDVLKNGDSIERRGVAGLVAGLRGTGNPFAGSAVSKRLRLVPGFVGRRVLDELDGSTRPPRLHLVYDD